MPNKSALLDRTVGVLFTAIVADDPPIHRVAKLVVHRDSHLVGDSDKQVDEVAVVHLLRDVLQEVHQLLGHAQAAVVRLNGHGRHVPVPVLPLALRFAQDVPEDPAAGPLGREAVLGPLGQVAQVEAEVVGLGEDVEVHLVEVQEVVAAEPPDRRHGSRRRELQHHGATQRFLSTRADAVLLLLWRNCSREAECEGLRAACFFRGESRHQEDGDAD